MKLRGRNLSYNKSTLPYYTVLQEKHIRVTHIHLPIR